MGYLEGLKVVTAVKPSGISPILYKRGRVTEKLYAQIECAKAKAEGRDHFITYMRSYRSETGEKVQSQQVKKVRPWWYRNAEGKLVLEIRYANKRVELAKGKTGIEVSDLNSLIPAIELVIKAVESGELDNSLIAISSSLRADLTK